MRKRKKKQAEKPTGAVHRCKSCHRRHGSKEACTVNVLVPTPTLAIEGKAKKGDRARWHGMMKQLGLERFRIGEEDLYIAPNRAFKRSAYRLRKKRSDGTAFTRPPRRRKDRRPLFLRPTTRPGVSRKALV